MNEIIGKRAKIDFFKGTGVLSLTIISIVFLAVGFIFLIIGDTRYFDFSTYGIAGAILGIVFLCLILLGWFSAKKNNSNPNPVILLHPDGFFVINNRFGKEIPIMDRIISVVPIGEFTNKAGEKYGAIQFILEKNGVRSKVLAECVSDNRDVAERINNILSAL